MKHVFCIILALCVVCSTAFAQNTATIDKKLQSSKAYEQMRDKIVSLGATLMFEMRRNCKESKMKRPDSKKMQKVYIKSIERSIKQMQKFHKKKFKKEQAAVKKKKISVKGIWHHFHLLKRLWEIRRNGLKKAIDIVKKAKLGSPREKQTQQAFIKRYSMLLKLTKMYIKKLERKIKNLK